MAKNSINDIAAIVARKQKISKKEAVDIVTAFFNTIADGLRDDRQVKVRGLGTFKVTSVKARESVNVNTGERVVIEGHDKVSFVPDTSMKELVNKPFAQFTTVVVNDGVNFDSIDAASAAEERKTTASESQPEPEQEIDDETEQNLEKEIVDEEDNKDSQDEVIEETNEEVEEDSKDEVAEDSMDEVAEYSNEVIPEQVTSESTIIDSHVEPIEPSIETAQPSSPEPNITVDAQKTDTEEAGEEKERTEREDDEPNVSREYFDEQMSACRRRCNRNLALSVVLLIVGLVAGFFIGHYVSLSGEESNVQTAKADTPVVAQQKVDTTKVAVAEPKDTVAKEDTAKAVPEVKEEAKAEEEKPEVSSKDKDESVEPDIKKLNSDRRLRFGAYEIVGIDKVIRLKKGQTMKSYSNKTLGKDMVVYFQVLNGVDDMKPGDSLKVPKIRLKKQYRK